jgi:hypothetical protein
MPARSNLVALGDDRNGQPSANMRRLKFRSSSAFGHVAEASLGRRSGLPPVDELSILLICTVHRRFASNEARFRGRRSGRRELRCPYQDFATLLRIADPEERAQQPKHLQIRGAAEFSVLHWSSQSSCGVPIQSGSISRNNNLQRARIEPAVHIGARLHSESSGAPCMFGRFGSSGGLYCPGNGPDDR